jgi:short-subunit dehydrogenase
MRVRGRRVLLTGASRGLGAALARALHARGADLALVARPSDALEQIAAEAGAMAYPCDLSDLTAIPGLVDAVEGDGPIDLLINNAGVSNVGWFLDRTMDEIDNVVTLNLLAPLHLCRLIVPGMVQRGRGHVVNMSSMAAVIAPPGLVAYGASKAGLSHATAVMRADLRDEPVTFTVVHLGSVKTDMDDEARSYGPLRALAEKSAGRDITPMNQFIATVLRGIEADRDEIRVPRMMAPLAMLANAPRQVSKLVFKRAPAKELRSD